tara:strand:+ start:431 stop:628 length:198 start_codon:yes stop_codon:yes gene_type:complete
MKIKTAIALDKEKANNINEQDGRVNLNDLLERRKHQDHLKKILNFKIFIVGCIVAVIAFTIIIIK